MEVPDAGRRRSMPESLRRSWPLSKARLIIRGKTVRISRRASCAARTAGRGARAESDDNGFFSLTFPAGLCNVVGSANGYHKFTTDETLEPTEVRSVKYYVLQKNVGYETVIRDVKEKKEVVDRTLTREELQKVPAASETRYTRAWQDFPGVARSPYILGQLIGPRRRIRRRR